MIATQPWQAEAGGLRLYLRVTPKARREAIGEVIHDADGRPVLSIRVTAPPSDGAANRAVIALLAKALGVPKSAVTLGAGASSRTKTVVVAGDPECLVARVEALAQP